MMILFSAIKQGNFPLLYCIHELIYSLKLSFSQPFMNTDALPGTVQEIRNDIILHEVIECYALQN